MRMQKPAQAGDEIGPETRSELHRWVRDQLSLPPAEEQALLEASGLNARCELLIQLMQFFGRRGDGDEDSATLQ